MPLAMDLLNSTHSSFTTRRAGWKAHWAFALCTMLALSAVARPCKADDAPTIFGYALEGFGTGLSTGLAVGYIATGPEYESGEWKKLVYGGAIGSLTGLGLGVVLGIADAASGKDRGVGFYMIRDSNYGVTLGFLVGGIVGAFRWADDGSAKDLARGMAWGTIIGAGSGLLVGVLEGVLRNSSSGSSAPPQAKASSLRLGIAFTAEQPGSVGVPYPTLSGRF